MVGPMSTDPLLLVGNGRLLMAQPDGAASPGPLTDWAVRIGDGLIGWVGARRDAPSTDAVVDLGEALVTPGLVDSHTHPAFVGDRSEEAAARLEGASYIGGGILRTVAATRAVSDEALRRAIAARLRGALATTTTASSARKPLPTNPSSASRKTFSLSTR